MITKDTCRTLESLLEALPSSRDRPAGPMCGINPPCPPQPPSTGNAPIWAVQIYPSRIKGPCATSINVLSLKPMNEGLARDTKTVTETVGYLQIDLTCRFQVTDRGLDDDEDPEDQYNQAEELLDFTTDIINTYA